MSEATKELDCAEVSSNIPVDKPLEIPQKTRRYTLSISERLYNRIDHQAKQIKYNTKTRIDKSKWILGAIEEKLKRDHQIRHNRDFLRMKSIQILLPEDLAQILHTKIEETRKLTGKGSLKTWIVDAIEEKFEQGSEQQ